MGWRTERLMATAAEAEAPTERLMATAAEAKAPTHIFLKSLFVSICEIVNVSNTRAAFSYGVHFSSDLM